MEKKKLTLKEIGIEKLIIILLAGVFLIVLSVPDIFSFGKSASPTKETKASQTISTQATSKDTNTVYVEELENKLKSVLEKVDGIGNTEVMITLKASKESVILKNNPYSQDSTSETDSAGGSRISSSVSKEDETVIVDSEDGSTTPYVIKEIEPEIEGVVVIAEGGGNAGTINEIINAVEVLFDVPAHKIKVMKMNDSK